MRMKEETENLIKNKFEVHLWTTAENMLIFK